MSELNTENYSTLHNTTQGYGRTGLRLKSFILPLIQDAKAVRILDHGCGKGALGNHLREEGHDIILFDPYVEAYKNRPDGHFDIVLSTDVLEHISLDELSSVLEDIKSFSDKAVFVISLTFADQILQDGKNAHCTIQSKEWWAKKLSEVFPKVYEASTRQETACCFVTWDVSKETSRLLERRRRIRRRKERLLRKVLSPIKLIADRLKRWVTMDEALSILEGKSVAIIGNSTRLTDAENGHDIDEHDIVVRLNRAPIMSKQSHGTKTDWIATSTPINSGLVDGRKVSLSLWMTAKCSRIPVWMFGSKRKVFRFPKSAYRRLKHDLSSRPSSGFMVIDLVRKSKAKSISIYGFDGFVSGSLSSAQTKESAPHNFDHEYSVLQKIAANDPRFRIVLL
jgi:hypothetical protein